MLTERTRRPSTILMVSCSCGTCIFNSDLNLSFMRRYVVCMPYLQTYACDLLPSYTRQPTQSDVTAAIFSPYHPHYIVGGTYSGQIVLWDSRASSPMPVLKSLLSANGHKHPVYTMSMVGTQNAHNLVSMSADGMVCSWQMNMLAQPLVRGWAECDVCMSAPTMFTDDAYRKRSRCRYRHRHAPMRFPSQRLTFHIMRVPTYGRAPLTVVSTTSTVKTTQESMCAWHCMIVS